MLFAIFYFYVIPAVVVTIIACDYASNDAATPAPKGWDKVEAGLKE